MRRAYQSYAREIDVLADFENRDQLALFHVESDAAPAPAPPVWSGDTVRAETGTHSLSVQLGAADRLVFDVGRLVAPPGGDWRGRSMLMLSVHAPTDGVVLAVRVEQAPLPAVAPPQDAPLPPLTSRPAASDASSSASAPTGQTAEAFATSAPATNASATETAPTSATASEPTSAASAAAPAQTAWERRLVLRAGWNLLRIDLDDVSDEIAREQIRSISLSASAAPEPIELHLDDVLLADDSREIVAPPDGEGLYVSARGRRLMVAGLGPASLADLPRADGSPPIVQTPFAAAARLARRRRFELAFADGVIVRFRGESELNLGAPTGLGPWPLALSEEWWSAEQPPAYDDAHMFEAWGSAVAASQTVVEATPFRTVVRGRWRCSSDPTPAASDAGPGHTWEYTIYPDGRVYVRARSESAESGWPMPYAGYAFALAGRRSFESLGPADGAGFVLMARSGPAVADLLWAPNDPRWLSPTRTLASADDARLAVIGGTGAGAEVVESAHMLRFWPRDLDDAAHAAWMVQDYREPAALKVTTGDLLPDVAGDLNHDGFNESQGCDQLLPSRGIVRLVFPPSGRLRYRPVFRIHETAGKRIAVYLNGRVLSSVGRDASDEALIMVPLITDRPFALEVVLRER